MRTWNLAIPLDPASRAPLSRQIAGAIQAAVLDGRLKPGDPLPGSRALAAELGLNRNLVLNAYQFLQEEGFLITRPGGGSFLARPAQGGTPPGPTATRPDQAPPFSMNEAPSSSQGPKVGRNVLACLTGHADLRMLPAAALSRAYRRSLEALGPSPLSNADERGNERLRQELARMLNQQDGLQGDASNLLITGGIKDSLNLVARALVRPGDAVAVEALGARTHWEILTLAGARLVPIPVDGEGLDVDRLSELSRTTAFRAVLASPRCQYPTTTRLSEGRRKALLEWAHRQRAAILELDLEAGISYEHPAGLPLVADDRTGSVIYFGGFSKVLFPNLGLAYVQASASVVQHLVSWKIPLGDGADPALEMAMAELFREGEILRHLNRVRKTALDRRNLLADLLAAELGDALEMIPPANGSSFWLRARTGVDVYPWAERAPRHGVAFSTGRDYAFDRSPIQAIRLGFASHDARELREVVARMAQALRGDGTRP